MKHKLLEGLILGLLTLGFLSPVLMVSGWLWYHQPQASPSVLSVEASNQLDRAIAAANLEFAPLSPVLPTQDAVIPLQPPIRETQRSLKPIQIMTQLLLGSMISAPLSFFLGMVWYKHYCVYRSVQHTQRVAFLERLWQQSIQP